MIKKIFLTFLIVGTITIKTKRDKSKENKIINGNYLDELKDGDIYVGQSENEVLNLLGEPFKIPGQENTLYYFKSVRSIYPFFPLKGKIKSGTILIIELNQEKEIVSFKKQEYKKYKTSKNIEIRLKELAQEIKKREKEKKEFFKKLAEKEKKRINKLKKKDKKTKVLKK